MTRMMPAAYAASPWAGLPLPKPQQQTVQTYLPVMRGGRLTLCTDSEGTIWPCLSTTRWNESSASTIHQWRKAYGLRPYQPDGKKYEAPTPCCRNCTRLVCQRPAP